MNDPAASGGELNPKEIKAMEITFLQLTKEELTSIVNDAVRSAMSTINNEQPSKPFLKGLKELEIYLSATFILNKRANHLK
jgi:hypothetical protein